MTDETGPAPDILARPCGPPLAYRRTAGQAPGVVFLGGFMSDMTGEKASALDAFCRRQGRAFLRFDYRGHGASGGRFKEAVISDWLADTLAVLDRLTEGPQVLVGSSMGGWLMLLAALARPERVHALIGIAPAADFVRRMEAALTADQRRDLDGQGFFLRPSEYGDGPYTITKALIEDGKRHCLLDGRVPISRPVRLLHGMRDDAVPWRDSLRLADCLDSEDVRTVFVKDGNHRLSRPFDLALLTTVLEGLLRPSGNDQ
ncbi:MAG: alpha/beta hydrolase [Alphaproteobacteria bacterium]|nr:alpha/beta hydrolase [Alphaproteobacteria bacterium]